MDETSTKMKERIFECPHCHQPIRVRVKTEILEVVQIEDDIGNIHWAAGLTPEQRAVVETAKETGILAAFERATNIATAGGGLPRSMERFFVGFLKTATPKVIPRFALHEFIKVCDGRKVDFWVAQGVGVVLGNNEIRLFIPSEFVIGKLVGSGGKLKMRTSADEDSFRDWMRSGSGRVLHGQPFDILRHNAI